MLKIFDKNLNESNLAFLELERRRIVDSLQEIINAFRLIKTDLEAMNPPDIERLNNITAGLREAEEQVRMMLPTETKPSDPFYPGA